MPLLPDPRQGSWLRRDRRPKQHSGRSQPHAERVRQCHSDFWLLTPDFHILEGYQGRSPCLVRAIPKMAMHDWRIATVPRGHARPLYRWRYGILQPLGGGVGEARLIESLRRHRGTPTLAMVSSIVDEVRQFSPKAQHDDITLIVAKRV